MTGTIPLVCLAERFVQGDVSPEEFSLAYAYSWLLVEHQADPGLVVAGAPTAGGFVPTYASEEWLRSAEGDVPVFEIQGWQVLNLAPTRYAVALDPGSPHEVYLAAWAVRSAWRDGRADLSG